MLKTQEELSPGKRETMEKTAEKEAGQTQSSKKTA
jgi:hypothetical protein